MQMCFCVILEILMHRNDHSNYLKEYSDCFLAHNYFYLMF